MSDCDSILDLGCGDTSPIRYFSETVRASKYCVGVDVFAPDVRKSSYLHIHKEYVIANALDANKIFKSKTFDAVIALDLIEHLRKNDGTKLLDSMEQMARKKVIVFTPNGYLLNNLHDENIFQEHLSGWGVKDFEQRGYEILGINGWKPLRGDKSLVRLNPEWFWIKVSDLTQLLTRAIPKHAFQLLCVKSL